VFCAYFTLLLFWTNFGADLTILVRIKRAVLPLDCVNIVCCAICNQQCRYFSSHFPGSVAAAEFNYSIAFLFYFSPVIWQEKI